MSKQWILAGTYFEACNCDVVCPCFFGSPPTGEECTVFVAWHIDNGKFDDIRLDGLSVALAAHRLRMASWKDEGSGCLLYVDERATQDQKVALTKIFSGQVGGVPVLLTRVVGRLLGVGSAPIEYKAEGKKRSLRIPEVIDLEIEALPGQDGTEITLSNLPNTFHRSMVLAKSQRLSYHDHGLHWEVSEKNGCYSPFAYQAG